MPALTPARRSELRAKAHGLAPVVMIGDKGLSDSVVAEVDRALKAHALIKVKAASDDREARVAWMAELCERLGATSVQLIGKILVIWRENPDKAPAPAKAAPKPGKAPKERKKPGASARQRKAPRTAEELIRNARRQSRTPSPHPAPSPPRRRPRTSR